MYYNKSLFLDYIVYYVYENNVISEGRIKIKYTLNSQVTIIFSYCVLVLSFHFIFYFFFTKKIEIHILLYSNVIEPLILQNV